VAKQIKDEGKDDEGSALLVRDPKRPTEDAEMRSATRVLSYHQTVESRLSISSIGRV